MLPVPDCPNLGGTLAARMAAMFLYGVSVRQAAIIGALLKLPIQPNLRKSALTSGLPTI
jgi:hypothetical protein